MQQQQQQEQQQQQQQTTRMDDYMLAAQIAEEIYTQRIGSSSCGVPAGLSVVNRRKTTIQDDSTSIEEDVAESKSSAHSTESYKKKKSGKNKMEQALNFVERLMLAMNDSNFSDFLYWNEAGDEVRIADSKKAFTTKVLPAYFERATYGPFVKELLRWGFVRRPAIPGVDDIFAHKYFRRDSPGLISLMHYKHNNQKSRSAMRAGRAENDDDQAHTDEGQRDHDNQDRSRAIDDEIQLLENWKQDDRKNCNGQGRNEAQIKQQNVPMKQHYDATKNEDQLQMKQGDFRSLDVSRRVAEPTINDRRSSLSSSIVTHIPVTLHHAPRPNLNGTHQEIPPDQGERGQTNGHGERFDRYSPGPATKSPELYYNSTTNLNHRRMPGACPLMVHTGAATQTGSLDHSSQSAPTASSYGAAAMIPDYRGGGSVTYDPTSPTHAGTAVNQATTMHALNYRASPMPAVNHRYMNTTTTSSNNSQYLAMAEPITPSVQALPSSPAVQDARRTVPVPQTAYFGGLQGLQNPNTGITGIISHACPEASELSADINAAIEKEVTRRLERIMSIAANMEIMKERAKITAHYRMAAAAQTEQQQHQQLQQQQQQQPAPNHYSNHHHDHPMMVVDHCSAAAGGTSPSLYEAMKELRQMMSRPS